MTVFSQQFIYSFGVNGTQGFLCTTFTLHAPLFFLPITVFAIYKVVVPLVSLIVKNSGNIPLPLKNPLLLIKFQKFNWFLIIDIASFCRLGLKANARMSWCTIELDPGKLFSSIKWLYSVNSPSDSNGNPCFYFILNLFFTTLKFSCVCPWFWGLLCCVVLIDVISWESN